MSLGAQIAWDDSILPFQLDAVDIRGRFARIDRSIDEILKQHAYPEPVAALVAEAALLTTLIGQAIKLRWKLSLQIRSDGPVRFLATDYYGPGEEGEPARIRAYASFDEDALKLEATGFEQLGKGIFGILIDQGPDMTPYQGITPLSGGSLSACAESYFAQSEQIPTRFQLGHSKAKGDWRAGGIMIQHMPQASPHTVAEAEASSEDGLLQAIDLVNGDGAENWNRVNLHLDTVTAPELVGPDIQPTEVLVRLFHEERPRAFDPQAVEFGCTCSEQRIRDSLSTYRTDDLSDLITDEGTITADCQFCGKHYSFDPATLGSG